MAVSIRNPLVIAAAAVVVAAGALIYYISQPGASGLPAIANAAPAESSDDLMAAGPLGERSLGDPNAPVTVIEYASMTCSHCAHFHETTFAPFKEKYVDTGKVHFIFREFPLDPLATSAFMLARCLPEDRYFAAVDVLFRQQANWAFAANPADALLAIARQIGFTEESFKACLTNQQILDGVNAVKERAASEFAVNSTPTFFINGTKRPGALTLEDLDQEIQPLL